MTDIHFEWDGKKNKANIVKHKISFEEAKTVFYDDNARVIADPEHSAAEDRFVILGISASLKLLVVCHCFREPAGTIRIISARKATKNESKYYGGQI